METIFVSNRKPTQAYVLACLTALRGDEETVELRARGKAINSAVDVSQVLGRILPETKIQSVKLGTEELENNGRISRVSSIQIIITK